MLCILCIACLCDWHLLSNRIIDYFSSVNYSIIILSLNHFAHLINLKCNKTFCLKWHKKQRASNYSFFKTKNWSIITSKTKKTIAFRHRYNHLVFIWAFFDTLCFLGKSHSRNSVRQLKKHNNSLKFSAQTSLLSLKGQHKRSKSEAIICDFPWKKKSRPKPKSNKEIM